MTKDPQHGFGASTQWGRQFYQLLDALPCYGLDGDAFVTDSQNGCKVVLLGWCATRSDWEDR